MYSLENLKDIYGWLFTEPIAMFVIGGIAFIFTVYYKMRKG